MRRVRKPKHVPYGQKRVRCWIYMGGREHYIAPAPNKKRARLSARAAINLELEEMWWLGQPKFPSEDPLWFWEEWQEYQCWLSDMLCEEYEMSVREIKGADH